MAISVSLIISNILVLLGLYGAISRRDNLIITMVFLEIALLGVALLFVVSAVLLEDTLGGIAFFILLTLAGVESAIGLALIIVYYRLRTHIRWSPVPALCG